MSNPSQARKNLEYVDPARFTPYFAWKARGEAKEVYCEGVALAEIAKRFRDANVRIQPPCNRRRV